MSRFSTMPRAYRRQLQAQDEAKIADITRTAQDNQTYANTPGGDSRKLRGIPAIGRSVRGAIADTVPGEAICR